MSEVNTMITLTVKEKKADGLIWYFKVNGHSNHAPKGYDIICAAVSTLCFTALRGLQEVLRHNIEATIEEGKFEVIVINPDKRTEIVLRTMLAGFENIKNGTNIVQINHTN
jgi:uncharacterized protein YsxB (DUF464 family)